MAKRRIGRSKIFLVTESGPFLEGRGGPIVKAFMDEAKQKVADTGVNELHARMGKAYKERTGAYESHIVTEVQKNDRVITDNFVIYGPWLEGTSRRNETSRFKGYGTFRKTRLWMRRKAGPQTQELLDKYVAKLNGGVS